MPETTLLIKAALNLRVGAVFDVYEIYKKGLGNNTNIFPIVVREFPLIDIPVYEQERIVAEIHAEINKQEKLKAGISDIQQQIDQIVEDCISQ